MIKKFIKKLGWARICDHKWKACRTERRVRKAIEFWFECEKCGLETSKLEITDKQMFIILSNHEDVHTGRAQ